MDSGELLYDIATKVAVGGGYGWDNLQYPTMESEKAWMEIAERFLNTTPCYRTGVEERVAGLEVRVRRLEDHYDGAQ